MRVAPAVLTLLLVCLAGAAEAAPKPANLSLAAGKHVGVLNLLDAEVTQFHASRHVQNSFLKPYSLDWPVNGLLLDALRERLTQMGRVPVATAPSELIRRGRETCLLNAPLAKGLPKECRPLFAQFAAAEHLDALILFGPGLNDGAHAGSTRHRELPEYLRGWCFVTEEGAVAGPALLNLTELLLISVGPTGADVVAREWGGEEHQSWAGFKPPADLKELSDAQLAELQPLFNSMLKVQTASLLGHLEVTH